MHLRNLVHFICNSLVAVTYRKIKMSLMLGNGSMAFHYVDTWMGHDLSSHSCSYHPGVRLFSGHRAHMCFSACEGNHRSLPRAGVDGIAELLAPSPPDQETASAKSGNSLCDARPRTSSHHTSLSRGLKCVQREWLAPPLLLWGCHIVALQLEFICSGRCIGLLCTAGRGGCFQSGAVMGDAL